MPEIPEVSPSWPHAENCFLALSEQSAPSYWQLLRYSPDSNSPKRPRQRLSRQPPVTTLQATLLDASLMSYAACGTPGGAASRFAKERLPRRSPGPTPASPPATPERFRTAQRSPGRPANARALRQTPVRQLPGCDRAPRWQILHYSFLLLQKPSAAGIGALRRFTQYFELRQQQRAAPVQS